MNPLNAVTTSKTLTFWLWLVAIAIAFVLGAVLMDRFLRTDLSEFVNDILSFLGIAGGGGTARNIISDGVMPRIPQAVGANKDPQVAIQPPMSMQLTPPAPSAPVVFDPYAPIGGGSNGNG